MPLGGTGRVVSRKQY